MEHWFKLEGAISKNSYDLLDTYWKFPGDFYGFSGQSSLHMDTTRGGTSKCLHIDSSAHCNYNYVSTTKQHAS